MDKEEGMMMVWIEEYWIGLLGLIQGNGYEYTYSEPKNAHLYACHTYL